MKLDLEIKRRVPTVQRALAALVAMERELAAAKTYQEIRKIIREAKAIDILHGHVDEVRAQAQDTILVAHRRIAVEVAKVPKASGGDRKSKLPRTVNLKGRSALGIPGTSRARLGKLATLTDEQIKAQAKALRASGKDATVTAVVRELTQGNKKQRRAARERMLGEKQAAMSGRKYGVILADPPWRFEPYSADTGMDRAADNHYPTMGLADICKLDIPGAADCVLFLWATVPMLPEALQVVAAWGFTYKSNFLWLKDEAGTGFWNRNQHEHLLVATRGNIPAPALGEQYSSVITAPRGRHSQKPFAVHEMIETMFPTLPRLEMFAREQFAGWDCWGNELPSIASPIAAE